MLPRLALAITLVAFVGNAQTSGEAEVREVMQRFLNAFQDLDWPAFRRCWSDRPVVFHPSVRIYPSGSRIDHPDTFDAVWKQFFQTALKAAADRSVSARPYLQLEPKDLRIDFPAADVAVVTFHLASSPSTIGRRMFVLAHTESGWKITHLHASNLALGPEAERGR